MNPGKYYRIGFRGDFYVTHKTAGCGGTLPGRSYKPGIVPTGAYKIGTYRMAYANAIALYSSDGLAYSTFKKYSYDHLGVKPHLDTFVVAATARLDRSLGKNDWTIRDAWTIDQDKILTHEQKGK